MKQSSVKRFPFEQIPDRMNQFRHPALWGRASVPHGWAVLIRASEEPHGNAVILHTRSGSWVI